MKLSDFDYHLPPELIAQFPSVKRGESRLLAVIKDHYQDHLFSQLPDLLNAGDLLVFNNTKVVKARLFGKKSSGGQIEALIERIVNDKMALAHIRASKSPKPGSTLCFADGWEVRVVERVGELFMLELMEGAFAEMLSSVGQLPLPPYIMHSPSKEDEDRYQTVYAQEQGAVAAPTAGLHFTEPLLETLTQKGIETTFLTLHVGAGTFQPVRVDNIAEHKMHKEQYYIPSETKEKIVRTKKEGGRIIAVGTTTLRALEASSVHGLLSETAGDTDIFITPGFRFQIVDTLITNFHLPKSTLLMLVSAFFGYEDTMNLYRYAIAQHYRFFSYGDAMILPKKQG